MKAYFGMLLLVATLCCANVARAAGPKLAAEGKDFSFGEVFQGQKVTHVFHFKNVGSAPLRINRVRTTCGCTAALLSSVEVAVGGTASLRAVFDSTRFQGPEVKTIYLYTNDPLRPIARFTLRGRVLAEIVPVPARIEFRDLKPGQARQTTIRLFNRGEKRVTFSALRTTVPGLTASLSATALAPGKKARLQLRITPKKRGRRISGYVLLHMSGTHLPQLRIPIFGTVSEGAPAL